MSMRLGHLAISASAGTGKTFQLAHRFIALLMLGVAPENIMALTFSRKAAREIFDRVILLLADAASSEAKARERNRHLGGEWDAAAYCAALRNLLEKLPRSRVGTIDSFMVGVVRAFPFELGLEPEFQVFDSQGHDAEAGRREAMRRVLAHAATSEAERRQFFEAFKYATFGHEEKRSSTVLGKLVNAYQTVYRLQPSAAHWGIRMGAPMDEAQWRAAIAGFRVAAGRQPWGKTVTGYWREWCDELEAWRPDAAFGKRTGYVLRLIAPEIDRLGVDHVALKFSREEFLLDPETGGLLSRQLRYMGEQVVLLYSIRTQGMFQIMDRFERQYDMHVRRRGFLTFDDALFLLRHRSLTGEVAADDPARLAIEYRLDGKFDHWLIDEFQDTSTMQWQVLSNLIDEVVQDPGGQRTFFYVGDIKQAIYGWRGGNAALFNQILRHYNRPDMPAIERRPLDRSFRSSAPVIELVNRAFRSLSPRVNPSVRASWRDAWHDHACAEGVVPDRGYAALIELPDEDRDDEEEGDDVARYRAAAALLAGIDPLEKGLTAAVLCRSNKAARIAAETIRAHHPEWPVALEGQSLVADNPAVCLLLSLLEWAEHPGDGFARRHLQLFGWTGTDGAMAAELLDSVQRAGFHATLAAWKERMVERAPLSAYEAMRVEQLLELAARCDREPSRDIGRFVEAARAAAIEDQASRRAIRVMTIHKSKGLDFDVVVLPDLQGSGGGVDDSPMVKWSEDRTTPEWILQRVRKALVPLDERLRACAADEDEIAAWEDMCVLYVAITRAARAVYLIATEQNADSEARNHANMLRDVLVEPEFDPLPWEHGGRVLFACGDAEWHRGLVVTRTVAGDEAPDASVERPPLTFQRDTGKRAMPSRGSEFERTAASVLGDTMRERRELGSRVHAVLEQIEWLDGASDLDALAARALLPEAVEHARRFLGEATARDVFTRPSGEVEVWREQSFEIMLNGEWVSGVFDRVVLRAKPGGGWSEADIIDYKTNRIRSPGQVDELAAHYRPQMLSYRAALAGLTGLDPDRIRLTLVFTDTARAVTVEPAG